MPLVTAPAAPEYLDYLDAIGPLLAHINGDLTSGANRDVHHIVSNGSPENVGFVGDFGMRPCTNRWMALAELPQPLCAMTSGFAPN